ncbi:MAG: LytTR family transcriptional regulator DNA-binding domain-containing protein [Clostridiales bacterium]|nr:LytTR family transcriptional regulator DNA-binding domain-containing protein [Clostridiales bacterium]
MRLILKENHDLPETEVEIRYRKLDSEVEGIVSAVRNASDRVMGIRDNGDHVPVPFSKILYFEAVDRFVFAYTSSDVYKVRNTLYELEDDTKEKFFLRISKSVIVNLRAVRKISPDEGRKLRLLLSNGETVIVSRGFVTGLKTAIGMKGGA